MTAKSTREKSTAQEKFLEKELDARRTPNSGATFHTKGDLQDDWFIFEAKTSMKPKETYSVPKSELLKLERERFESGKKFNALVFDFGVPKVNETYVVMPLQQFKELYEFYKDNC